MDRRNVIRKLFFSGSKNKTLLPEDGLAGAVSKSVYRNTPHHYVSNWQQLPDSTSLGEDLWSNHSADWCIKNRELYCVRHNIESAVYIKTYSFTDTDRAVKATAIFRFPDHQADKAAEENFAGFRLGFNAALAEDKKVIAIQKGMDMGVTRQGFLFINDKMSNKQIKEEILVTELRLILSVITQMTGKYFIKLIALDKSGNTLVALSDELNPLAGKGYIGLMHNSSATASVGIEPSVAFKFIEIEGRVDERS